MKIFCLLNETKSFLFHFLHKLSISSFVSFWDNKGIMFQTLRRKQKYQVTNVSVEKIKLSRLLVQPINEFERTKFNVKHHSKIYNRYFWALN